jgi:hypothetical protein
MRISTPLISAVLVGLTLAYAASRAGRALKPQVVFN